MPRIAARKKEYMISDLSAWIAGKMYILHVRQADMAEKLNINQSSLSNRMRKDKKGNPKDSFSYGDLLTIFKELEATDEDILRLMRL